MTPRPDFQVHEIYEPVHYTARELLACRRELRGILIAPFNKTKCKGLGYNISPSELCYSVKKKYPDHHHRQFPYLFAGGLPVPAYSIGPDRSTYHHY